MRKTAIFLSVLVGLWSAGADVRLPVHQDAFIEAPSGDTNYGSDAGIWARAANPSSRWGRMGCLSFDLSAVSNISTMVNVTLELHVESISHTGSIDFNVYGITDSWDESTLTWNNAPAKYTNSDGSSINGGAVLLASTVSGTPASLGFVAGQPFTISSPELLAFMKEHEGETITLLLAPRRNTSSGGGIWFNARESHSGTRGAALLFEEPDGKMLTSVEVSGPATINEQTTGQYMCMAFFDDGSSNNVTDTAVWSEDHDTATMAAGLLHAGSVDSNETVTVSADYTYGVVTKSNSLAVTISDVPLPIVTNELFREDFERGDLTSFTEVDMAGGTSFSLSTDGVSGYAGQVGGNVGSAGGSQPGAWLQANGLYLSATNDFSISYDVKLMPEGTYDDSVLVFGDLDGGNYYASYMNESLENNEVWYYNAGARISSNTVAAYAGTAFMDDTWYSVTCTWAAASQTLFFNAIQQSSASSFASYTVVLNGSESSRISLTNFSNGVQVGFGTHNDGARFDNVVIKGASLPAPEPVPIPEGAVEIAPDGVWTWFNDERAIWHQGYLFSGYVKQNGEYGITRFNPADNTSDHMIISTAESKQADDHNNPSITVLPDDRLLIAYSKHITGNRDHFFSRTSNVTIPASISDWGAEQKVILSTTNNLKNCYNNTYRLTGEDNRIYNFHRYLNFNPTITVSTNSGTSWEESVHFIKADNQRPYPRYCSDRTNRVDMIYTDGHPDKAENSIYHLYYEGGNFHKTDGMLLSTWDNLPIDHDAGNYGSVIYQYNADAWGAEDDADDWIPAGRGWTWDICYQTNGNPVCVFQVSKRDAVGNSGFTTDRIYYYYARWTGTEWQRRFIAQGGRPIYDTQREYGGGMTIDPDNPKVVYISSNAENPFDLSSITNVPLNADERYEIYRGVTEDGGLTFSWTAVTTNSPKDNLRPIVPEDHGYENHVVWFYGTYTSFFVYNCQVLGIFDDGMIRLSPWRSRYGLTNGPVTVDSDGDGLSDLAEYALGGNPADHLDAPWPELAGGAYRFVLPADRIDVESIVQVSTNLVDGIWDDVAVIRNGDRTSTVADGFRVESDHGDPERISVPFNTAGNEANQFMRLKIQTTE